MRHLSVVRSSGGAVKRQRLEPLAVAFGLAAFEGAVGAEQDGHVVVGVVAKPHGHAGVRVQAKVFPGAPQRFEG
jgi:ABC-type uncharacterized transport system permease subunit